MEGGVATEGPRWETSDRLQDPVVVIDSVVRDGVAAAFCHVDVVREVRLFLTKVTRSDSLSSLPVPEANIL